jgi:hypothetical protein
MKTAVLGPEFEVSTATTGSSVPNEPGLMVEAGDTPVFIPSHPLKVKPSGNKYSATRDARDAIGTFQILPDEVLALVLEYFDSRSLRHLGSTCKALYAFSRLEDLWKALLIE